MLSALLDQKKKKKKSDQRAIVVFTSESENLSEMLSDNESEVVFDVNEDDDFPHAYQSPVEDDPVSASDPPPAPRKERKRDAEKKKEKKEKEKSKKQKKVNRSLDEEMNKAAAWRTPPHSPSSSSSSSFESEKEEKEPSNNYDNLHAYFVQNYNDLFKIHSIARQNEIINHFMDWCLLNEADRLTAILNREPPYARQANFTHDFKKLYTLWIRKPHEWTEEYVNHKVVSSRNNAKLEKDQQLRVLRCKECLGVVVERTFLTDLFTVEEEDTSDLVRLQNSALEYHCNPMIHEIKK